MVAILRRGEFSLGASNLGNTLGDTGVTGTRVVLAGTGNITLSQATDLNGGTIVISGAGGAGAGFSAGVSGGNTAGDTGATGTRLVFAGGNNVTLSQATDVNGGTITVVGPTTVAQTVQTQNRFNLTLSGNTAGVLAEVSSGTLTLAGGSNVTLSQNGNAISIHAGGGAETQTAISGISASDTVYTSGTVNIVGSGDITVLSGTGQRVIISGSQSVQPETQTFLGGIAASNTTYTSGTVRITGVGGGVTVSSNTGQRVDISVAAPVAQTEQTQSRFNLTISGNTAGAGALISSGVLTLAGGNNITVSQNGNALTISGPNVGGAQTGISGLANSETTYTSGSVTFSALGAITIRSTTGQHFQFSVNSQTAESQSFGMSNIGNTSGTTGIASGAQVRFLLAGGNNITLSQSLNGASGTITISAASQSAESQSIGMSNLGNTSGTTGIASGPQVRFLFAGGNNITLSQSLNGASGTITISGPNTAAQSVQSLGMYAVQNTTGQSSSTTMDARTISIAGDGAVSVGYSAGSLRISAPVQTGTQFSAGLSNLGNTAGHTGTVAGRVVLVGSNNVTLSGSTNGVSQTISILAGGGSSTDTDVTAINQTGHGFSVGDWIRLDGTSYELAQADSVTNAEVVGVVSAVADADNFTLITGGLVTGLSGLTAGAVHWLSADTPGAITDTEPTGEGEISKPVLIARSTTSGYVFNMRGAVISSTTDVYLAGVSNVGNTSGNTGITGSRLVLAGGNNITLSQSTNASGGTVTISAPTQTGTQFSAGLSNIGNTAGDTGTVAGRLVLAGGNNITLSGSTNGVSETITISAGAGGGFSAGVSNVGNTQGDTGVTGTRLVLAGTNNITLSQSTDGNGATVRISGQSPAGGQFSAGASNLGNTAGATGISGTQMVLVGSGVMSLSQTTGANGNTVSILGPATSSLVGTSGISISTNGSTISVMQTTGSSFRSSWQAFEGPMVNGQQGQGSVHFAPYRIPDLHHDRALVGLQISNATNSSNSISLSAHVGVYSRTGLSLSLISSTSVSTNFTGSGTVGSYSLYGGMRYISIPWTNTLTEGDYWIGMLLRTTTGGGAGHTINQLLRSEFTAATLTGWSGLMGAAATATAQLRLGLGVWSATSSSVPGSAAFTQITGSASVAMREPYLQLRSGTV